MKQIKRICMIIGFVLLLSVFNIPLGVEAKEPDKDMRDINISEYCNSNIRELKKDVKLLKEKKNMYYDKYKTTYITTDKNGDIIKINIKGDSKKARKYAPSFGEISIGKSSIVIDMRIEDNDLGFSFYENPYIKGDVDPEKSSKGCVFYFQEFETYNSVTVKCKKKKKSDKAKWVYNITWELNGVTDEKMHKYKYHDVNAELEKEEKEMQEAESSQKGTESTNFENGEELSLPEKIGMYQEQCIYIEDTAELLRNPSTYDGQQILIKGRINPVTEELLSLDSGDDIYIANRANLFDADYNRIENILKGDTVFVAGIYHVGGIETITRTWNCIDDAFIILGN